MAGHGKSSSRASTLPSFLQRESITLLNCRFSMQILHFGSGGLKVRDAQPNLLTGSSNLTLPPQCWDCPQIILLFKLSVAREKPDTPPTPDGRAEVLEPAGSNLHAVAGSVQDAALPLYRAG